MQRSKVVLTTIAGAVCILSASLALPNAEHRGQLSDVIGAFSEGETVADTVPHPLRKGRYLPANSVSRRLVQMATTRSGLFVNKTRSPRLKYTVLVTTAEWEFRSLHANWVCFAKQIGLDYIVLSADEKIHHHIGDHSIRLDGTQRAWGNLGQAGCRKMEAIHRLTNNGYSVLFADAFNVLGKVPQTLFREIAEGKFDALLRSDSQNCVTRRGCRFELAKGTFASSGMFYWSARRPENAAVLARAVQLCGLPRTAACCDPQQALNQALHEVRSKPEAAKKQNEIDAGAPVLGVTAAVPGIKVAYKGLDLCRFNKLAKVQRKSKAMNICVMDPKTLPALKFSEKQRYVMCCHPPLCFKRCVLFFF